MPNPYPVSQPASQPAPQGAPQGASDPVRAGGAARRTISLAGTFANVLLIVAAVSGCAAAPGIGPGRSASDPRALLKITPQDISPESLAQAGQGAWLAVLASGLDQDPSAIARLTGIAARLRAVASTLHQSAAIWRTEVAVTASEQPDVWCFSDGRCAVTRGMTQLTAGHDYELAAALAHELAHVVLDHPRERLAQARQFGAVRPDADILLRPYDRVHEIEAERIGVEILARAGFDPHAALGLRQRLAGPAATTGAAAAPAGLVAGVFARPQTAPAASVSFQSRHSTTPAQLRDLDRYALRMLSLMPPARSTP